MDRALGLSILLCQSTMITMLLLKEIRHVVRFWQAAVLEKGFILQSCSVELCFNSSKGSFHYSIFFSFCHLPSTLCGIDGTTLKTLLLMNMIFGFMYWIGKKNGSPKDILGWFRTVETFMWSNLKVIWIYLNYNELGYQMELFLLQIYI